jgi:hypothetical protein
MKQSTLERRNFLDIANKLGQRDIKSPRKFQTKVLIKEEWPIFLQD